MSSHNESIDEHRCTICEKILENRKLGVEHVAKNHSDIAQ